MHSCAHRSDLLVTQTVSQQSVDNIADTIKIDAKCLQNIEISTSFDFEKNLDVQFQIRESSVTYINQEEKGLRSENHICYHITHKTW